MSDSNIDASPLGDPWLDPFRKIIGQRGRRIKQDEQKILETAGSLYAFSDYHDYFGLHLKTDHWVFREWAPHAEKVFIIGEDTGWTAGNRFELERISAEGVFEGRFPLEAFWHEKLYRLKIVWPGGEGDRIPTAARRVVQDNETLIFNTQAWHPPSPYRFVHDRAGVIEEPLLIYEAHTGMALEEGRVGTYQEFRDHILPKIKGAGYNALQLMAVAEHPYYGSFGYHVSSFFAPSSRFGTPDEFKALVDQAHDLGIRVLIDIVHSHAVSNEVEGLSRFDGSLDQFFYPSREGFHPLWDSRCFDYSKPMVIRFLLSNLRYWLEEFRVDGFRFDGITSMIYRDHGLNRAFAGYEDYYRDDVRMEALSYLYLANRLVHDMVPSALTIAEDMSGYPGLASSDPEGGIGFDYRFSMGVPDLWIKLLKEVRDENWPLGFLWHELTTRRTEEQSISYAECHDQALVGDQTIMMRLMGSDMYTAMSRQHANLKTDRGLALHKIIRLITAATAGSGYLNFMGNEFGHPEWIDFPSNTNNWSFDYARRQWSLKYNPDLHFMDLYAFDRAMITLITEFALLDGSIPNLLHLHQSDQVIAFDRRSLIFAFNLNPFVSFTDYQFDAPAGRYRLILDTDEPRFGGQNRLAGQQDHFTLYDPQKYGSGNMISLYLPARTAMVLEKID